MTDSTDPYLYPGTDVLKNLRDICNPGILARFEAQNSISMALSAAIRSMFSRSASRNGSAHFG
jgi:hypothetical protein